MKNSFIISILILFVVVTGIILWLCHTIPAYSVVVLMAGNVLMVVLSVLSYTMVHRQMNGRPQAFVRGVSGASFLKLMVCMVAILAYLLTNRDHIYKPTIFILFGIYAIYTTVETIQLSKLARGSK